MRSTMRSNQTLVEICNKYHQIEWVGEHCFKLILLCSTPIPNSKSWDTLLSQSSLYQIICPKFKTGLMVLFWVSNSVDQTKVIMCYEPSLNQLNCLQLFEGTTSKNYWIRPAKKKNNLFSL